MSRLPQRLPSADAINGEAATDPQGPPLPEAFQVHDLSRRYVQFRMQQELAQVSEQQTAAVGDAPASFIPTGVAPISSIAVPDWLRGRYQIAPVSFAPGCSPLSYRPSGFLARTAEARRAAYYGMMSAVACEHGIPTGLFDAMIIRESGYNPVAVSTANAFGLAQLMPGTAAGLGVNRFDPLQNMRGGARYLRQQLDRFGQVQLALAAYNAGPGRVRNGRVPQIAETQRYVTNIIGSWARLTAPTEAYQALLNDRYGEPRSAAIRRF
ncbi:MAG: lytic transglycosylase domain-containing protein [Oxalobacteraceae bacterium]|nr:MAG: lytic transglycosylase domain-containing protein [Oxalobacteraceae bacterium]